VVPSPGAYRPTETQWIKRPNFSVDFKRQLVEETLKPEASAALVAREHQINANLRFK
jgi:transposase